MEAQKDQLKIFTHSLSGDPQLAQAESQKAEPGFLKHKNTELSLNRVVEEAKSRENSPARPGEASREFTNPVLSPLSTPHLSDIKSSSLRGLPSVSNSIRDPRLQNNGKLRQNDRIAGLYTEHKNGLSQEK
jgi:hypothetical protein